MVDITSPKMTRKDWKDTAVFILKFWIWILAIVVLGEAIGSLV